MKSFLGFGFGPIQTGLMLLEAMESGNFSEFTVAEIDQGLVDAVRANSDSVHVNIAGRDGIRTRRLSAVRMLNPRVEKDLGDLREAASRADEIATAIPSVKFYAGGPSSPAGLIGGFAGRKRPCIVYTAENNNYAAEVLSEEARKVPGCAEPRMLQPLNTVIGKMSGVISSVGEMEKLGLAPMVPGSTKCVLVEEFNRILITRIAITGFRRGIPVFEEKDDLLPFEEAKLYGHNAVHALLGYLAREKGLEVMSGIRRDPALMDLGRRAFLEESGAALTARHASTGDPLFTADGWKAYAEDLLERMTNPFLHDRVERIIRDPRRKLGYGDRLFGTMRAALSQGIEPRIMARGAAAAVRFALEQEPGGGHGRADAETAHAFLTELWRNDPTDEHRGRCLDLVLEALRLRIP